MTINRKLADYAADVPATIGSAGQVLKVNSGATAYEWQDIGDTLPSGAAAGQALLRNSGNTAYEWGTISTGLEIVFPSDWASPTNTYTASGTWSKGSLSDDAYVWIYLIGGGGGGGNGNISGAGNRSSGGAGGNAIHIYGKAGVLNGGTYVVGAGAAGATSTYNPSAGGATTFTLTAANGGTVFNTALQSGRFITTGGSKDTVDLASFDDFVAFAKGGASFTFTDVLPTGVTQIFGSTGSNISSYVSQGGGHTLFSGGGGGGQSNQGIISGHNSEFAGNGGDGSTVRATVTGAYPGGGGAGSRVGLNGGGDGAAGNVRVYHV